MAGQSKQTTSLHLKILCFSYTDLLGACHGLYVRLQSFSISEDESVTCLLAATELYNFLVSNPQEKSYKVSWTIGQKFCSCYPFGLEKLIKVQGAGITSKGRRNWCMNQYFFQMILYIYKEWIDPLFLRRKTTVIHHINVLLSYLPMSTLSSTFQGCEASCLFKYIFSFLLLFLLCYPKEYVAEGSQIVETGLIDESN